MSSCQVHEIGSVQARSESVDGKAVKQFGRSLHGGEGESSAEVVELGSGTEPEEGDGHLRAHEVRAEESEEGLEIGDSGGSPGREFGGVE